MINVKRCLSQSSSHRSTALLPLRITSKAECLVYDYAEIVVIPLAIVKRRARGDCPLSDRLASAYYHQSSLLFRSIIYYWIRMICTWRGSSIRDMVVFGVAIVVVKAKGLTLLLLISSSFCSRFGEGELVSLILSNLNFACRSRLLIPLIIISYNK